MNPRATPPDNPNREPSRPRLVAARAATVLIPAGLLLGFGFLVSLIGCGKPPEVKNYEKDAKLEQVPPWKAAAKQINRDPDFPTCKLALAKLNNDLLSKQKEPQPSGLSREAEATLTKLVPLSDDDLAEIRSPSYSAHDAAYVAECLYLRDAVRTMEVPGLKDAERADLGFTWVCRQVFLQPWLTQPLPNTPLAFVVVVEKLQLMATALPPSAVLRRGHGSGLERMYVFLALLQQMGLDGCLVGSPTAGGLAAQYPAVTADNSTLYTNSPRGPFWAVGVRIGGDVRLYDPWRGQPFPVTLNELRANRDAQKAWLEAKENVSGLTAAEAKTATVFLAVPVNSLAPRMTTFEEQTKAELGLRVAVNPEPLRNAFADPKPAFWNPPSDRFAYGRTARTFLPVDEGGNDQTERGLQRLSDRYVIEQVPPELLLPPRELRDSPDAVERMRPEIANRYFAALFSPPSARERIQRGQFQDAARSLVAKQDEFSRGIERLRNEPNLEAQVAEWVKLSASLDRAWGEALLRRNTNPEEEESARQALDAHWRTHPGTHLIVDRAVSDLGRAEVTLLLALCKHEQAERLQSRLEHANPAEAPALRQDTIAAWKVAVGEWRTYAARASAVTVYASRIAHMNALKGRAEKLAQQ